MPIFKLVACLALTQAAHFTDVGGKNSRDGTGAQGCTEGGAYPLHCAVSSACFPAQPPPELVAASLWSLRKYPLASPFADADAFPFDASDASPFRAPAAVPFDERMIDPPYQVLHGG